MENQTTRSLLVECILNKFLIDHAWDPLYIDVIEGQIQKILSENLAFKAKVKVERNDELNDRGLFNGAVTFDEESFGEPMQRTLRFVTEPLGVVVE
jgi:hypothetical protein